MTKIEII